MTVDSMLRLIAGSFVLISVILGVYVSPYFFLFTGFVALNLITRSCSRSNRKWKVPFRQTPSDSDDRV
jgi:hypothetical protein